MPTCQSSDRPDEYRFPSSSIEHFCILIVPKCRPADLPTYSPVYLPRFPLIQVPTCHMNTSPTSSIIHFCMLQVLTCQPADLPTCHLLLLPTWSISIINQTVCWCLNLYWCTHVSIPNPRWWIWLRILQSFPIINQCIQPSSM